MKSTLKRKQEELVVIADECGDSLWDVVLDQYDESNATAQGLREMK